jgi:hypothetical protein
MMSSKQTQLNKTTNNRYWLFLLSFFTVIFPYTTIKAQGPQPLLGFDCFFANNDGPYVYPCAS